MEEYWFDELNKTLIANTSRRTILRAAAAAVPSLALGDVSRTEAAKNRKKKKDKRRKKGKDKPDPKKSCSRGTCAAVPEWIGIQTEINFCEFVCEQCDGADPRQFCIVDGGNNPVAFCCGEGAECCDQRCCGGSSEFDRQNACCDGQCVHTTTDERHCGQCRRRCPAGWSCVAGECIEDCAGTPGVCCGIICDVERTCCPDARNPVGGFLCAHLLSDRDHCGGCGNGCGASPRACCNGGCVDTSRNNSHCGTCFFACRGDRVCRPGQSGRGECQAP